MNVLREAQQQWCSLGSSVYSTFTTSSLYLGGGGHGRFGLTCLPIKRMWICFADPSLTSTARIVPYAHNKSICSGLDRYCIVGGRNLLWSRTNVAQVSTRTLGLSSTFDEGGGFSTSPTSDRAVLHMKGIVIFVTLPRVCCKELADSYSTYVARLTTQEILGLSRQHRLARPGLAHTPPRVTYSRLNKDPSGKRLSCHGGCVPSTISCGASEPEQKAPSLTSVRR